MQDLSFRISAGPLAEDSLVYTHTPLYQHSARWTRTISAKGRTWKSEIATLLSFARWAHTISTESCTSKSEIATLPAFRAMDTHDLRRGLHFEIRNRNFTCIPRTRHARSLQEVALRNQKSQLYQHFPRWTHMISAEGCTSKSEIATLLAFGALDTDDLRRGFTFQTSEVLRLPRNHEPRSYEMLPWPRKSILKLKFQKCSLYQELSPSTSKHISMARIRCACHVKRNPSNDTPANGLATSTKYCTCPDFHNVPNHVNSRF